MLSHVLEVGLHAQWHQCRMAAECTVKNDPEVRQHPRTLAVAASVTHAQHTGLVITSNTTSITEVQSTSAHLPVRGTRW